MAIRVYRVAVVGCPRALISSVYEGAGKSCLCNRFVRPEAFVETHNCRVSEKQWLKDSVTNGDHFIYWGAATKNLPDGSKGRFQIVEHTEFYNDDMQELVALSSTQDYFTRASAVHFKSANEGKTAYKYKTVESGARRMKGPIRNTQLFPNGDFSEKSLGVYGFVCVFDPTLEGEMMESQLAFWSNLLPVLVKRKRKIAIACVKCDAVDEMKIKFASNIATHYGKKSLPVIEVSAVEGINVEEAFFSLVSPMKKSKLTKNGKRSAGYLPFKNVQESRKGDLNRAKDSYRSLLQKRVTSFQDTWSEVLPSIEREPAFRAVCQLSGAEAEETVLKMFQLRLIEIKLIEAGKIYSQHNSSKMVDKGSSQSYQGYLSSAFKGHPDLGNESLYDYVYSPRSSISDISPTFDSDAFTEPSLPSSYRNTPDLRGSHSNMQLSDAINAALNEDRPRSSTFPESSSHDIDQPPSSATLPRAPSGSKSQFLDIGLSKSFTAEGPPPLPPRAPEVINSGKRGMTHSHSFMEIIPEDTSKETDKRRLSNSMDCLLQEENSKEKRFQELAAEPYLQPCQVVEMMTHHEQTQSPLRASSSPSPKEPKTSIFHSMRVKTRSRPPLPTQTSDVAHGSPVLTRSTSMKGHKRSRSNPWVLDGSTLPPELPRRNIDFAPPIPPRPAPISTSSAGSYNESVFSPVESSLEFGARPPLPVPRKVLVSDKSPIHAKKMKQKSFEAGFSSNEDPDLDLGSGDIPDSPVVKSATLTKSPMHGIREIRLSDEDDDPDDPSNHYARIEDIQKYVTMSSAPINIPKFKGGTLPSNNTVTDTDGDQKKSQTLASGSSAPALPLRKPWKKQSKGPIIHDAPSSKATAAQPTQTPSHERKTRPLPPSPTKPRRHYNNTKGTNIYEAIDDLRQGSKKQYNPYEHLWAPPVEAKLQPKYVEAVAKFFAMPDIKEKWIETLKSVLPEENVESMPMPYQTRIAPDKGQAVEQPRILDSNEGAKSEDTDQSTPSPRPKIRHKSTSSVADDNTIPITTPSQSAVQPSPVNVPVLHVQKSPFNSTKNSPFQSQTVSPFHSNKPSPFHSNKPSPFQSPRVNPRRSASREDLIEILNQQLNKRSDSLSSDSDSESESSSSEEDSDLEDPPQTQRSPVKSSSIREKMAIFQPTDLDIAIGLRASVSTDSDIASDQPPPRPPLPAGDETSDGVEVVHNVRPSQFIKKRGTSKRRNFDVGDTSRNLSDSGISNCHSQTFEDGFVATHQTSTLESDC